MGLSSDLAELLQRRTVMLIDDQHARLSRRVEEIRRSWASRGLWSGGMLSEISDAYVEAMRERVRLWLSELRQAITAFNIAYYPGIEGDLKSLAERLNFRDLEGGALRDTIESAGRIPEPAKIATRRRIVGELTNVTTRLLSEVQAMVLELKGRAQPSRPARQKQDKFGILDSPAMFALDIEQKPGLLGSAVIYLDLDDFKALNTKLTEVVVDRTVLPPVHTLIGQLIGNQGFAYAEGGDEFKVLLPNATMAIAIKLARELRIRIAGLRFTDEAKEVTLTASLGIAHFSAEGDAREAETHANEAKRFGKANGKNNVAAWGGGQLLIVSR